MGTQRMMTIQDEAELPPPTVHPGYQRLRDQAKAHLLVSRAVKSGELVRPKSCQECGATPPRNKGGAVQIHGHQHKGYDHPLDVQWLCPMCHNHLHLREKALLPRKPDPLGSILDD